MTAVSSGATVEVVMPRAVVEVAQAREAVEVRTGILDILAPYRGDYEVTPSEVAQVLPTTGRGMAEDIVVLPIPSNYGLVTRVGANLVIT